MFFFCQQVKGVNYSLEAFIGNQQKSGDSLANAIKRNKSEVCAMSLPSFFLLNTDSSFFFHSFQIPGYKTVSMCNLFSTRWLSPFPFTNRMATGSSSPFPWRIIISKSKNRSMVTRFILFKWTCVIHGSMEIWIL